MTYDFRGCRLAFFDLLHATSSHGSHAVLRSLPSNVTDTSAGLQDVSDRLVELKELENAAPVQEACI